MDKNKKQVNNNEDVIEEVEEQIMIDKVEKPKTSLDTQEILRKLRYNNA